jgi:hypothetical protein
MQKHFIHNFPVAAWDLCRGALPERKMAYTDNNKAAKDAANQNVITHPES